MATTNPFGQLVPVSYESAPPLPPPHPHHRFLHALGRGLGIAGAVAANVLMPGVGGMLIGRMASNVGTDPTQYARLQDSFRLQNQIRMQGQIQLQNQAQLQSDLQAQAEAHMQNQMRMQGQMQEEMQGFLTLQEQVQSESRMFEAMSSVLKAKHDSAMDCLRNISR